MDGTRLIVNTNIWRTLEDFSAGSVCLVIAEYPFDEEDYIRDYNTFIDETKRLQNETP